MNDLNCDDAIFFNEAMSALGFKQHVSLSTHQAGNILDLILIDPNFLPISKCVPTDFISDHRLVVCQTNLRSTPLTTKQIKVRKIICTENFAEDLDISAST